MFRCPIRRNCSGRFRDGSSDTVREPAESQHASSQSSSNYFCILLPIWPALEGSGEAEMSKLRGRSFVSLTQYPNVSDVPPDWTLGPCYGDTADVEYSAQYRRQLPFKYPPTALPLSTLPPRMVMRVMLLSIIKSLLTVLGKALQTDPRFWPK